ncbi:Uncharacterised protein [Neisseria zoodegmatis]|uniref:Uncharacterized protein n=1 Tax=Neisseria zoodegmatis TaxID=326523 RepID=A0A378WU54_9NEIS|nr:hypothetical protein [Neisseria zoodegmatis]SUA43984.1 Uncharacterised protein [Neisseria zoodegmatis]
MTVVEVIAVAAGMFKPLIPLILILSLLFSVLTKPLRNRLADGFGFRPKYNSALVWNAVKEARASDTRIRAAFYTVWAIRIVFALMTLSVFAQMMQKDIL